jgi:hypothetical protein
MTHNRTIQNDTSGEIIVLTLKYNEGTAKNLKRRLTGKGLLKRTSSEMVKLRPVGRSRNFKLW